MTLQEFYDALQLNGVVVAEWTVFDAHDEPAIDDVLLVDKNGTPVGYPDIDEYTFYEVSDQIEDGYGRFMWNLALNTLRLIAETHTPERSYTLKPVDSDYQTEVIVNLDDL